MSIFKGNFNKGDRVKVTVETEVIVVLSEVGSLLDWANAEDDNGDRYYFDTIYPDSSTPAIKRVVSAELVDAPEPEPSLEPLPTGTVVQYDSDGIQTTYIQTANGFFNTTTGIHFDDDDSDMILAECLRDYPELYTVVYSPEG